MQNQTLKKNHPFAFIAAFFFLIGPLCLVSPSFGAPGDLIRTLNNPTPEEDDFFGWGLGTRGNDVLVGAPGDKTGAFFAGSAYVFDSSSGALIKTINNPAPSEGDTFGYSVDSLGNDILVGAWADDASTTDAGTVYLFDGNTYELVRTFNHPNAVIGDGLGWTVMGWGDKVVAAAPARARSGPGAVHIFDAITGNHLLVIENPSPDPDDFFGLATASLPGNRLAIGAHLDDTHSTDSGRVYVFNGFTGELLVTIDPPDRGESDHFGFSLASQGNELLVGSYNAGGGGTCYLFDSTTGGLLRTINNPRFDPQDPIDGFGHGVAFTPSGHLFLAAGDESTLGEEVGATYLFDHNGNLLATMENPTPQLREEFGFTARTIGEKLVSCTPFDEDVGAFQAGAVYIHEGVSSGLGDWRLLTSAAMLNHYPGTDLLIGTGDDVVSANRATNSSQSAPNSLGAFSFYTVTFANFPPDPAPEFGANVIRFTSGTISLSPTSVTQTQIDFSIDGGALFATEAFLGGGTANITFPNLGGSPNAGTINLTNGQATVTGDVSVDALGGPFNYTDLSLVGAGLLIEKAQFGTTGNAYVDNVLTPAAQAVNADRLFFLQFSTTLPPDPNNQALSNAPIAGLLAAYSKSQIIFPSTNAIIDFILGRTAQPDNADINNDGDVDIGDVVKNINDGR